VTTEPSTRIVAGPRWDALLESLDGAEAALEPALDEEAVAHGWTDELRLEVLEAVQRVRADLGFDPTVAVAFGDWAGLDEVDPTVDDALVGAILTVDFCSDDLERVGRCVEETRAYRATLTAPTTPEDDVTGFDERVRDALATTVDAVADRLAAGEYLVAADVAAWFQVLAEHGVRRRTPEAFLPRSSMGALIEIGQVEEYPKGRRWEAAVLFDGTLWDVVRTDVEGATETPPWAASS
jgi:hypothetical protein